MWLAAVHDSQLDRTLPDHSTGDIDELVGIVGAAFLIKRVSYNDLISIHWIDGWWCEFMWRLGIGLRRTTTIYQFREKPR
jgi:hypothetical protein